MNAIHCPDAFDLAGLLEQDAEGSDEFARHLETCGHCQQTLEELAADESSWRELNRFRPHQLDRCPVWPPPSEPALERAIDQFKTQLPLLLRTDKIDTDEDLSLSFLRPADRPGFLGYLGEHEVLEVIGQGGMGVVLKAFDPGLQRLVAIKVIAAAALAGSAGARRRFTREAKAAAAVNHDHVVAVHGVSEEAGLPYLVMQYIAGESLQARLDRRGALAVEEIIQIGIQTAQGLAAAHAQGLIHRDIKPANILLSFSRDAESSEPPKPALAGSPSTRNFGAVPSEPPKPALAGSPSTRNFGAVPSERSAGRPDKGALRSEDSASRLNRFVVKITDFGLARMVDDVALTRDGVVAGTPEYMAPEQSRGESVDHRSDLFSLGSVLYACCTGVPPFRGSTALAVLRRVSDETPAPVRSLNPEIPAWLEELISRLMAKNPDERFQSASVVTELLEEGHAQARQPGSTPVPDGSEQPSHVRKLLGWLTLSLIVIVAGLGVTLGLLADNAPPKAPNKDSVDPHNPNHVTFDFRKGIDNLPPCTLFGTDADTVATTDQRGLRINLAAGREHTNVVGVDVPISLRGDFDINFGYEALKVDGAIPKNGKSVAMRVMFGEAPFPVTALICRGKKLAGDHFETFKLVKDNTGNDRYHLNMTFVAAKLDGRLRLIRTGSLLHYLVADGGSETRELRSLEIGTDDVGMIRLYVTTDFKPAPLDVRFTDLEIRADKILSPTPSEQSVLPESSAPRSNAALTASLVIGLVLTLASAVGALLYFRRGRSNKHTVPATTVSFACAGCGKTLKAKPELAGKKVKCPKCGQAVSVPSIASAPLATGNPRSGQSTSSRAVWPLLVCSSLGLLALLVLMWVGYSYFLSNGSATAQTLSQKVSGKLLRRLRGHTGPVHDVRFTPNGRLVSTSGWPHGDNSLRIWDVATGQELARIATPRAIHSLELTRDARLALVGLNSGQMLLIDLETRQPIRSMNGHTQPVDWVGFAADGKHVFSASSDGTVRMWDLASQHEMARIRVAGKMARCGAVFSDGRRLLTGDNNGLLQVWDLATRKEIKRIAAGPWIVDSMSLRPGDRQALVAGVDGLRLFDLETDQEIRKFQAETEEVYHAAVSPDGRLLLTAGFDGAVRLWNFESGELLRELGRHQGFAFSVAFSPDGRTAASGGGGGRSDGKYLAGTDHDIRLWEMASPADPAR